jgi:hypothetical protein
LYSPSICIFSVCWLNRHNQRPRYCMASCCTLFIIRFVDCCLSFCTFSFDHCVVWSSSMYGFWLLLWYLLDMTVWFIYSLFIDKININLYLQYFRWEILILFWMHMQVYNSSLWSNSAFQDIQPNCFAGLIKPLLRQIVIFLFFP